MYQDLSKKSSSFVSFYIPASWFAHGIYYMEHRESWGHRKTGAPEPSKVLGPLVVSWLPIPWRIDIPSRSWIHLASYKAINLAIVLGHHLVLNMDEHVDIKCKKKDHEHWGWRNNQTWGYQYWKYAWLCVCFYFLRWTWRCHGHNPTSTKKDLRTENRDIVHTWWLAHDGWLMVLRLGV